MASSQPALTAVLAEQAFATGLGPYAASGSVSTGSYGARLRGGSGPGRLTGPAIDITGYGRLRLTVERATSGLDAGEAATITATTLRRRTRTPAFCCSGLAEDAVRETRAAMPPYWVAAPVVATRRMLASGGALP